MEYNVCEKGGVTGVRQLVHRSVYDGLNSEVVMKEGIDQRYGGTLVMI